MNKPTDDESMKKPEYLDPSLSTKQKILICAVNLFAMQGYTETSVRDIAAIVGINSASIYGHFASKEDLLVYMINDFYDYAHPAYNNPEMTTIIQNNPTAEGVLSCIELCFVVLADDYYSKLMHVIFQEQHRNQAARKFVYDTILDSEAFVERAFEVLKDMKVIQQDADPFFWKRSASSLLYIFPNRTLLGVGETDPNYSGKDLRSLLKELFEMIFTVYGL
ncbi:MAG: TetR/AcrR family transcriptional regulator [Coriobacteriia bacterium]|nr:TetR/AcrR family transcriptional regulator [Coriobacteriia bacterium]